MNGSQVRIPMFAVFIVVSMLSLPFLAVDLSSDDAYAATPSTVTYYDALNADGRKIYDAFVENAELENLSTFNIILTNDFDSDVSSQAFQAFKWSCPEYFWIKSVSYSYLHNDVDVTFVLIDPVEDAADKGAKIDSMQALIDAEVNRYVTDGALRYDLIRGFHDRMIDNCRYDKAAAANMSSEYDSAFDITGVFIDDSAVCQGYAMAMKYLCDIAGIPCVNVSGDAYSEPGASPEGHMWNYVMMEDGSWYCLDATWDDPTTSDGRDILRYDYYLVGADTVIDGMKFIESHVPDYSGIYSVFASYIPSVSSPAPNKLSSEAYPIRPGSEGNVNYLIGDGGDDPFVLTQSMIDPDDEDNILYRIGSKGSATVIGDGVRFEMSYSSLMQILAEMESTGTDRFVFGCEYRDVTLHDVFGREYTKEAFVPFILNGTVPVLDLDDVGIGIGLKLTVPYELTDNDVEFFLTVWSVDSDGELESVKSSYSDGYVTFSVDEMDEVYVITSNPLGDFSLLVAGGIVIGAVLIVLIILALIIRAIIKH